MTRSPATIYATSPVPLGNGAFTADGRLVVSHHPMFATPHRVSVFVADGVLAPYPDLAWNTPGDDPLAYLDAVLGLRADSQGCIWFADMGTRSGIQPKFVVWDTRHDALVRMIPLPVHATTPYSEPNDFVIDEVRGKLYIADEGAGGGGDGSRAALIVLDLATGEAQRRLEGYPGIAAESGLLVIDGLTVERNEAGHRRTPLRVGVDGIVMDAAGQWLYLSPLNGHAIWRMRVADLLNPAIDDPALAARMERYADKPNSGGMAIDADGNLYITVIENCAIGRISATDRSYDEPIRRADMFWPDGIMEGPDGALYVVCTQLPYSPGLARPGESPIVPFKVFRWDPGVSTRPADGDRANVRRAVRGAVAGVIAAGAVTLFEAGCRRFGLAPDDDGAPSPTEVLADRMAVGATSHPLSERQRKIAGQAIHLATGAGLGAAYALLAGPLPAVTRGRGAVFGLGVWAGLEETGLAVIHLKPPPTQIPSTEHAFAAIAHLLFGTSLDVANRLLKQFDAPAKSD